MLTICLTRPISVSIVAVLISMAGILSLRQLPISQFPHVAPPIVTVIATFPGATPEVLESSVTGPLEEALSSIQGLRYMTSSSSMDGAATITCTFRSDRDLDLAAADVQNAINNNISRIPEVVKSQGIIVSKNSGEYLIALALTSNSRNISLEQLTDIAQRSIVEPLNRLPGIDHAVVYGGREAAMRLWTDPRKLLAYKLTASDVVSALNDQNTAVAAGAFGTQPSDSRTFTPLTGDGRFHTVADFDGLVLKKTDNGGSIRFRDVGRAELGAENYDGQFLVRGRPSVGISVIITQDANALEVSRAVRARMDSLALHFPKGVTYSVGFDGSAYLSESLSEIEQTLLIAVALVALVLLIVFKSWRVALIPALSVPICLLGTLFALKLVAGTINVLTLFAATLAIGLVVDDSIVVIENLIRYVDSTREPAEYLAATLASLREIIAPIISTSVVLLVAFFPITLLPDAVGTIYRQFGVPISVSIVISIIVSLALSPALTLLLLRRGFSPASSSMRGRHRWRILKRRYRTLVLACVRRPRTCGAMGVLALCSLAFLTVTTKDAFLPDEDQGYFLVFMQLRPGATIHDTLLVAKKVRQSLSAEQDITQVFEMVGLTGEQNAAYDFVRLRPWSQRRRDRDSAASIIDRLTTNFSKVLNATVEAHNPPAIRGIGATAAFQFELLDQNGVSMNSLERVAKGLIESGLASGRFRTLSSHRDSATPGLNISYDRYKARQLNVSMNDVFSTMQMAYGATYISDFSQFGRSYKVYLQADARFRRTPEDLARLFVRNSDGAMIAVSQLLSARETASISTITHFNGARSIEITGTPARTVTSGEAITTLQRLATQLSSQYGYAWSGLTLEQIEFAHIAPLVLGVGTLSVFLMVAAFFESVTLPFVVISTVPFAVLGSLMSLKLRGLPLDLYGQVGLLMLAGLATKNALLIVDVARGHCRRGMSVFRATVAAAERRSRPIAMTSIIFMLATLPLMFSQGAGAAGRASLGTVIFGGMLLSTVITLFVVPLLLMTRVRLRLSPDKCSPTVSEQGFGQTAGQEFQLEEVALKRTANGRRSQRS